MTPLQRERASQQKKRAFLCVGLVLMVLGYVGWRASIFGKASGLLADELKGAAQDGLPLTADDFRKQVAIPPSENGASAMEEALSKYRDWSKKDGAQFSKVARKVETMGAADVTKYAPSLDSAGVVLEKLNAAAKFHKLVFDREWEKGAGVTFPEYADVRSCGELLYYKYRVQLAKGDLNGALDSLDTLSKVAALIRQDPTIIGILVGCNMQTLACGGIAETMRAQGANVTALQRCKSILSDFSEEPQVRHAIAAEFLMGLESVKLLGAAGGARAFGESDTVDKMSRFGPARDVYELRYVQVMRKEYVDLKSSGRDYVKLRNILSTADNSAGNQDWTYGLANILSPTYSMVAIVIGSAQAQANVLLAASDLLQAKAKTGDFPKALPGSSGEWLDTFTGKPLVYKPASNGFLIYSFGPNGKDDGGKPRGKNSTNDSYDIPFSYP